MQVLKKIIQSLVAHALPSACIACHHFQKYPICKKCLFNLQSNGLITYECCLQCGIILQAPEVEKRICTHCIKKPPYFDRTFCLDRYDGILQDGLRQLKYQKRIASASGLASAWNQIMSMELMNLFAHYLLPVPLSTQKLTIRGFNQSWELVKLIHCGKHIQKSHRLIQRHHQSQQQAGGSLTKRRHLINGMFYVDPMYRSLLEGKTVIVFDDVMTSGATLNEVARILKDNGAVRVINWVLLRALRPL